MKVVINKETIDEIKKVAEGQADSPNNIRIFVAGYGWAGPTLGLALDEQKENDLVDDSNEVTFVMEQEVYDTFGEITVEYSAQGYKVAPVNQQESGCSSCGGSCS